MDDRVFVSAVTKELGAARAEVARLVRKMGLHAIFQDEMAQGGGLLLETLRDQIAGCGAAILLMGNRSGSGPTEAHAAGLGPVPWFDRYARETGSAAASYTQWEFILAKHLGKQTFVFFADTGFPRGGTISGETAPDEDGPLTRQQERFAAWVKRTGEHYDDFGSLDDLGRVVPFLDLPRRPLAKPRSPRFVSIGPLFKGREADMAALGAALAVDRAGRAAIVAKPATVHGLGGVGKTQLAIEFGLAEEERFSALLFISGETAGALDSGLAELTDVLGLPERQAREDDVRIAATLGWLGAHDGWYLVIDNVDDAEAAKALEARLADLHQGSVAVTSRLSRWSRRFTSLELDVLSADAAVAFLMDATVGKRVVRADDGAEAATLAQDLQYLALGLEQAAAYIVEAFVSFGDYRALWRENFDAANDWYETQTKGPHDYPHSVAATWLTSFNRLSPETRRLLERLAWMAPEPIPLTLFAAADRAPLAELLRYSLARPSGEAGDSVTVHRLVQAVSRRRQSDIQALQDALGSVNAAFEGNPMDVRTWPALDPLAPHAAAVVAHADSRSVANPTSRLMDRLAMLWQTKARLAEAEPLVRRALAIDEASYGRDHPEVAIRLNNLAVLLRVTNRLAEAEPLYRRSLAIKEAGYGADHPQVAVSLNNLAVLLQATNRLAEAEPLFRRALAIDEASYGTDHTVVAIRLNNLAGLLQATNRLAEAEPLFRRALAIREASYGRDHPTVATSLNNLAGLLRVTNRLAEAEPLFRRALAIDEASYGREHPEVATDLNNLALLLQDTDRLAEAEPLYRRALAIREASYGRDHPTVATSLNNLAGLLRVTNRLAEAEPLYRRALAIDEASYGTDHPTMANSLNNLALLRQDTDRLAEAEPLVRRALAIDEASYGTDHTVVAIRLNNLAGLLQATNRLAEAEPLFRRALAIREASYGTDHPTMANSLNNLALLLQDTDRLAEAEPLFRRALAIDEASYGREHPEVATDLNNLAGLLRVTDRLAEAEPLFRRALAIHWRFRVSTGHVHPNFEVVKANYVGALKALGRDAALIERELAAVEIEARGPPPNRTTPGPAPPRERPGATMIQPLSPHRSKPVWGSMAPLAGGALRQARWFLKAVYTAEPDRPEARNPGGEKPRSGHQ